MRFLITGAAGFLGAALANQLAREGQQVRGLDDLSSGDPDALYEDIHFTRGDVNDRPKLWTLLQDVDCVYHLAARVLVAESLLYPREYNAVNVGGTVSLMEAMRDVGDRFGRGELILPFVLQSAEVMKRAVAHVERFLEKSDSVSKGTVVLATVFGDVIGQNWSCCLTDKQ